MKHPRNFGQWRNWATRRLGALRENWGLILLVTIPFIAAAVVWFSSLSFVPVPWPDDSAFYFVAKHLFSWPPRWVMLPQAPFEPTYRIFNFNTMPLYPVLIGLGRFIGLDGSFQIKFWPLSAWAASGSLLAYVLARAGLPKPRIGLLLAAFTLDPILRWGAVIVRPESLIGLLGMAIVLGLTFGFPKKFRAQGLWDPISFLLALGAYSHFNAVHLVFPVVMAFLLEPRKIVAIGTRTALYLTPWVLVALTHLKLFVRQMTLQWSRLQVGNDWLNTPDKALSGLFQSMGSPDPWPPITREAAILVWVLIFASVAVGLLWPLYRQVRARSADQGINLIPSATWVASAIWLWNSKPEVWFTYYIHLALWCFVGVLTTRWYLLKGPGVARWLRVSRQTVLGAIVGCTAAIFGYVDISQAWSMESGRSWHWDTYYEFVDCVDQRLTVLERNLAKREPGQTFQVWCPTFPDITVELSKRHPQWDLTRTNDFWNRADLAIEHGKRVQAVVVTETLGWQERDISAPAEAYPEIQSVWMTWKDYFLNRLWMEEGWKPNRYLCQRGRWQAFLFMKPEPAPSYNEAIGPKPR